MRNYDGIHDCQGTRRTIESRGYVQVFTTLYDDHSCPPEVMKAYSLSGWEIRKAIKAWAKENGYIDYVIFRATDYLRDLHGSRTYEFYAKDRSAI